jgi:hypothetical protein
MRILIYTLLALITITSASCFLLTPTLYRTMDQACLVNSRQGDVDKSSYWEKVMVCPRTDTPEPGAYVEPTYDPNKRGCLIKVEYENIDLVILEETERYGSYLMRPGSSIPLGNGEYTDKPGYSRPLLPINLDISYLRIIYPETRDTLEMKSKEEIFAFINNSNYAFDKKRDRSLKKNGYVRTNFRRITVLR